jgi:hypothetical protein
MKSNILTILKMRYNRHVKRNSTVKEYFKNHTVKECLKYFEIFNQCLQELNILASQIEAVIGTQITDHERINGFELGGD